ncbi:MAG: hypothetical protein ACI9F9_003241, partial [Candidatus Paceibacteria bacterium]
GWESISYGGEGEVEQRDGWTMLPMGVALTGIRRPQGLPRNIDYELELTARRDLGSDFFCGLTFPVHDEFATLIIGGWGGGLCGISCIDMRDASDNDTKSIRNLRDKQAYSIRLRVQALRIQAWLDGELIVDANIQGKSLCLRTEVLASAPLGISSYITSAAIGELRYRPLGQP